MFKERNIKLRVHVIIQALSNGGVVPATDSNGLISSLQIVGINESGDADSCKFLGRVVEYSKAGRILFKITRPGEKTLRITLIGGSPSIKPGQLLEVSAVLNCQQLQIIQVENTEIELDDVENALKPIDIEVNAATPLPELVNAVNQLKNKKLEFVAQAKAALENHTGIAQWNLATPVKRGKFFEWEVDQHGLNARVRVNEHTGIAQVWEFSTNNQIPLELEPDLEQDKLSVTPLGAARGIGASCFRVLIGPYEIVLDAGTRPKGDKPLPAFEYLRNPNLILISHAHQDHIGALPTFHKMFPACPMICTVGTRQIADVMLTDCLKIQQHNEDFQELFDENDLNQTIFQLQTKPVGVDFEPLPGLKVRFIHAGHILGAACIYIRYGERSLLYTGDYNTSNSRTTDGLRLADLPEADMLITESTYGADNHPNRKTQEQELLKAVAEVVSKGGNVLIPAFALGRAQEIILAIRTSALFHKLNIPVYVDGLVRAVTDVFIENINLLPASIQNFALQSEPFFNPDSHPPIIPIAHPKERPLAIAKPSVIIASSGMLSGGASVYYATTLLERDNAAVFISGYTDEESPGRFLQGLQQGDEIEFNNKKLVVKADIRRFNLSGHADKVGLTQVINRVNPKHLILIHGSMNALHELSRASDLKAKHLIHIPNVGEVIEYGTVPEQVSPLQLAKLHHKTEFEVKIAAEYDGAWIKIPADIIDTDPRWHHFSETGMLKAKWDGIALKLIPIMQHHLNVEAAALSGVDCCATCKFFQKKCCTSPDSPLYELQVDPHGKCLEFVSENKEVEIPDTEVI
ncbi:beta-lactamase domain protein [Crinalium epipsammum PCC 9333]|uniref:Beta-lactamase domain protein n=1 Tax=Crinalium epipsammum PCC 9333 TaxID=1173022 RepID=K9VTL9_9CYAN|nr:MBL fold metallo-hydrolase [Crinalium epipsammum]AFZ11428.1 beta-lactamase domain protein [Crinalium epipsammum PCC 9333]